MLENWGLILQKKTICHNKVWNVFLRDHVFWEDKSNACFSEKKKSKKQACVLTARCAALKAPVDGAVSRGKMGKAAFPAQGPPSSCPLHSLSPEIRTYTFIGELCLVYAHQAWALCICSHILLFCTRESVRGWAHNWAASPARPLKQFAITFSYLCVGVHLCTYLCRGTSVEVRV